MAHAGSPVINAVADANKGMSQNGEGSNDKTASLRDALPDLIIEGIAWSPAHPSIGETVTFTVTIKNQGSGRADYSQVAYYIDDDYVTSASVSPSAAGASENTTFNWIAQAGPRSIRAVADAENVVAESDETNNEKNYAFSVSAPDLIIQGVTWSPENPSIGDRVTFTVAIKNQGNSGARYSNVDFYIDGYSRGYSGVQQLDAGATATKTFTWSAQAGSHTIKAVADALNQVSESDETNNEKTVTFLTLPPDLIIEAITWSPESPSIWDTVTFTVTIKNQGTGTASSCRVAFYVDDAYLTSASVGQLDTGASENTTFNWIAQIGLHTIKAAADALNQVSETDETNNEKTVTLSPLAPDLIIEAITWSPESPSIGDTVTFTVTVKNQGGWAGSSRLYLYIDGSSLGYQTVPEIKAGAAVSKTFSWTAEGASHTIKAVVDLNNTLVESDETSNEKTVTFLTLPPDLIIEAITWSPESPSIENTVTFTVTIKNQGTGKPSSSRVAFYVDDAYLTSAWVSPLAAGASENTTFNWIAQIGLHTIKAAADSLNQVSESDETNNEKTVTLSPLAPDLVIEAITWSPESPPIGDTVTFTVTVKNRGTGSTAGYSYVAYYTDGSFRGYHDVPELEAGATHNNTFFWITEAGSHVINILADYDNRVTESDETNNEKSIAFPAPDLVIQAITWSPQNPYPSDNVTFTATIKNQGTGKPSSCRVAFYVDDAYLTSASVSPLAAGASENTTFNWIAQVGSHIIRVVVDPNNTLVESDETNNEKTVTLSVSPPPAPVSEPTSSPKLPEGSVHLHAQSSRFLVGQDIVLNLSAENPAAKMTMTVELMLELPPGMTVTSAEFGKGDEGQFFASYAVEAGDSRQIEVHIRPDQKGSFNIAGQLAYYRGDDKTTAERRAVSLPITVEAAEAPPEKPAPAPSPEKGIHPIWGFILTIVVLGGIVFVFLSYRLQRVIRS